MTPRSAWGVRRLRAGGPTRAAHPTRTTRRTRTALLGVPLLAVALAGCGIRSTEVPTEFGPAPSRVPCTLSGPDLGTQSSRGILVQVFLLCSSQLVRVDRTVRIAAGTAATERVRAAQALVDELIEDPSAVEKQAGYTTNVREGMTVAGPRPDDPEDALRLSIAPASLTPYALAQIICTFSA